jgi:hypothetical protein
MIEETIRALIVPSYENTYIGDASIDVDDCQWIRPNSGRSDVHFDKETYDYPKYTIYVEHVITRMPKNVLTQYITY